MPVSSAVRGAIDTGDTAWMLTSAAFVMLMVPGLALFYAGMVRRKNVLGTMMHSFAALGIVGVEWVVVGYALAFGASRGHVIGWDTNLLFLKGVTPDLLHAGTHVPELAFIMFQGMFAIITPALIAGAFAERVKFGAYALFILLWSLFIYNPLAHWVWGGGWLGVGDGNIGAIDFAGGTVVHIAAGASALVMALYLGKRIGFPQNVLQPNSLVLTLFGAGLLWFGWFGFNGGSAVGISNPNFGSAALAFSNTQIAAAAGGLAWLLAEWRKHGRPSSLGFASGIVAGLVAITPASGYVPPWAAIIIGAAAGYVCFRSVMLKSKFGYDDSLDAFGVHGVGGFLGALLTGVFCSTALNPAGANGGMPQFWKQLLAASTAFTFSAIGTLVLVWIVDRAIGFRISRTDEIEGIDAGIHGEQGWMLEQMPTPSVGMPGSQTVEAEVPARKRTQVPMH
ncbi:MAG TPA: ammonium transporter [Phycisphaerae bacterium]|nr:ammonium transporter [Phycisphaerae bacterium]